MPGHHTSKQKRQAKHIADSERRRGVSPKRAESIGWATVNTQKSFQVHGLFASGKPGEHVYPTEKRALSAARKLDAHLPKPGTSEHSFHMKMGWGGSNHAVKPISTSKSFKLVSIGELYADLVKDDGKREAYHADAMQRRSTDPGRTAAVSRPPPSVSDVESRPPKKFPRRLKPTVQMKPISDAEATARREAGTREVYPHYQNYKSLQWLRALKALAVGYSKVSGGGALRAPNRGYPDDDGELDLDISLDDLSRSIPGAKAPIKNGRPSTSSDKSPKVVDAGGATVLSNSVENVVLKAEGDQMATNFNDLFKAELGDDHLVDCPHCKAPINKSDLEKAHKGKGATTHQSGPKRGKSSAHVRDHNPEGGTMRGGDGRGVHTSSRGVPGAKKHDEVAVQSSGKHKGKLPGVSKAGPDCSGPGDDSSSGESDSGDGDGVSKAAPTTPEQPVKKSTTTITIRGTEHVQYIDDGSDARLAKAIAEGALGGTPPTQPLDRNHDLSHLLI